MSPFPAESDDAGHTTALKAEDGTKRVFLFLTRVQILHLILQWHIMKGNARSSGADGAIGKIPAGCRRRSCGSSGEQNCD
jgi:hypothetical protein